jgi:hypothetical protein
LLAATLAQWKWSVNRNDRDRDRTVGMFKFKFREIAFPTWVRNPAFLNENNTTVTFTPFVEICLKLECADSSHIATSYWHTLTRVVNSRRYRPASPGHPVVFREGPLFLITPLANISKPRNL